MTKTAKLSLTALALATLAACGGSSTPIVTGPQPTPNPLTFREIADIAADVNVGYNRESITPKALVPVGGSATYSGAVGGDITVGSNVTDIAGLMEMDVDFRANRVGGILGNFVTRQGDQIDGTLSVRNGVLNRQSNSQQVAIFGDVGGNLRSAAGEDMSVDARIRNSGFKGRNVEFVGGDIEGDIFVDGRRGDLDLDLQLER